MRPHPIFNISSGWDIIRSEDGIAYYDKQLEGKLLKIQKFFDNRFNIPITFRLDSCNYINPSERFTFGGRKDSHIIHLYGETYELVEHYFTISFINNNSDVKVADQLADMFKLLNVYVDVPGIHSTASIYSNRYCTVEGHTSYTLIYKIPYYVKSFLLERKKVEYNFPPFEFEPHNIIPKPKKKKKFWFF